MAPLKIVLILLSAVVVSGACARMLPLPVPVPLVQIAIGVFDGQDQLTEGSRVAIVAGPTPDQHQNAAVTE